MRKGAFRLMATLFILAALVFAAGCGTDVEELASAGDVEGLIELLDEGNLEARRDAALALAEVGDERAVEPLIVALEDEDEFVRALAAMALGNIGDQRAIGPLRQALEDEDERVREAATSALHALNASP